MSTSGSEDKRERERGGFVSGNGEQSRAGVRRIMGARRIVRARQIVRARKIVGARRIVRAAAWRIIGG